MKKCSYFSITLFFAFLDELVTINATPIRIIIIAMIVIVVIFSCNIAHPNKTAITGLTQRTPSNQLQN